MRRHERPRAGGQDEDVVRLLDLAAAADDDLLVAVDVLGPDAGMDADAVLLVPLQRIEPETAGILKPPRTLERRMRL